MDCNHSLVLEGLVSQRRRGRDHFLMNGQQNDKMLGHYFALIHGKKAQRRPLLRILRHLQSILSLLQRKVRELSRLNLRREPSRKPQRNLLLHLPSLRRPLK